MSIPILLSSTDYNVRSELFSQNEQGIYLDPTLSEAARTWRRNLLTYSEGTIARFTVKDQVSDAVTTISGFDNSIYFTDNSILRFCHAVLTTTVGVSHTFSIYVQMDDDSVPVPGATTTTGDFSLIALSNLQSDVTVTLVSGSLYRLSKTFTGDGTSKNFGIVKYTGQSAKGFRVTGYQVEVGSLTTYQRITDWIAEFKAAFPTHHLYTDLNGVTPAVAPGDSVGLILDQRQGALSNLGPELVTNGGFDTDLAGWSTINTVTAIWSSGVFNITADSVATGGLFQDITTTAAFVRITFRARRVSGTSIARFWGVPRTGGFASPNTQIALIESTTWQDYSFIIQRESAATGIRVYLQAVAGTGVWEFDNISIREVPGNHAFQPTTGAPRPALARVPFGGRRNLLTRTEEFDNAAWSKNAASVTANALANPRTGELTADLIVADGTANQHYVNQGSVAQSGVQYAYSVYVKAGTATHAHLLVTGQNIYAQFDLSTGALVHSSAGTGVLHGTPTATDVGNGWWRLQMSATQSSGSAAAVRVYPLAAANNTAGPSETSTASVYVDGAQLETGSSASNYQRVGLTTDVTEAGQPDCWALFFDGSDDFLQTNAIDFAGWTQETRRNLLLDSDQFDATGWTKTNTTITPNAIANPVNGAIDADLMIESVATGAHNVTRADFNCVAGQAYACSCYVKAAGRTVFQMVITSGVVTSGFANFDLQNGVVGSKAAGVTSTYMVDSGNGWYRCVAEFTSASTTTGIINFSTVTTPTSVRAESYTGDGTSGIYIYGGQWEAGTLTDYQRVGTDEMTVIAGVRKLSNAFTPAIVEMSTASPSNNGSFGIGSGENNAGNYYIQLKGTSTINVYSPRTFESPITNVLGVLFDISAVTQEDEILIRINGSSSGFTNLDLGSETGSGNFGNYPFYIGRRAGSSLPFNGLLHHFIARGRSTSGSKLTGAEKLTGKKSGLNI